MSLITNKVSNSYYKLITEQYFQKSPEPEQVAAKTQAPAQEKAPAIEQPAVRVDQKSEKHLRNRYVQALIKGMIEHHESYAASQKPSHQQDPAVALRVFLL